MGAAMADDCAWISLAKDINEIAPYDISWLINKIGRVNFGTQFPNLALSH